MKRIKSSIVCRFVSLCVVALFVATSALGAGNSRSAATQPEPGRAACISDGGKIETDKYVVELRANSTCPEGQECKAEVVIRPKADYHIDLKFPLKFTPVTNDRSINYDKLMVRAEDGKVTEGDGRLPVVFKVSGAGKRKIGGKLSFSIHNDRDAVMEKLSLEVEVDVK